MEFSRQEYWSGLPFHSPGDLPNPGIELRSPTLQADGLSSEPPGKPLPANAEELRDGFDPWVRKIPWKMEWKATPVFLSGEFHGQRSLVGYSPWDCKESDMQEQFSLSLRD